MQNSSLLQRGSIFFYYGNMENWDFFQHFLCFDDPHNLYMRFFQFKLSDSRQSLWRPDDCINIRMKILLKHLGMQVPLVNFWQSHRITNTLFFFFFLSLSLPVKLHRENHLKCFLCGIWLVHTKEGLEVI